MSTSIRKWGQIEETGEEARVKGRVRARKKTSPQGPPKFI